MRLRIEECDTARGLLAIYLPRIPKVIPTLPGGYDGLFLNQVEVSYDGDADNVCIWFRHQLHIAANTGRS